MTHTLHLGDCRAVLATLDDASIDAIVCDPPYELGFMGKAWDNTGIAYDVTVWQQCLRVLKPGGHLIAFGGSRTYHRLAVAIEDAGFEIRDQIQWIYGSGFPKSLDVSKALDKQAGAVREAGLDGVAMKSNRINAPRENEDAKHATQRANHHPTVKPLSLMRYLVRLVTPKGGKVLDPFMGSGSTGCAAVREGFDFVGIDITPEYVAIAQKRIAHYAVESPLEGML